MSRPAAPSYTVETFAPDVNYPPGGDTWNNNPTKVVPPGQVSVGFAPNQGNAAQYHNWLHNQWSSNHADSKAWQTTFRAWLVDRFGLVDLRNWNAPQASVTGPAQVRYCNATSGYYVCGVDGLGKATFARNSDPLAWPTSNEVVGDSFTTGDGNFDVAADGSLVIPGTGGTDGTKVLECTAAGVWTVRSGVFANALLFPDCVFEPVSANWIVFGTRSGAGVPDVYTSTNRTAWTSRTAPASIPALSGSVGPYVTMGNDGLGTVVAQFFPSSFPGDNTVNSISFACSADGGVTWSAVDTHTTTFAAAASNAIFSRPVWTGTKWVAVVSYINGTNYKTHVYNSTDGLTWASASVLTATSIQSIAAGIDGTVLGRAADGGLIYSDDYGVTWYPTGLKQASSTNIRVHPANGGYVITDYSANKLRHSLVLGQGPGTALT